MSADYSHGGSQGFKSPHLHPHKALVTGLADPFRRAGAVPTRLSGSKRAANADIQAQSSREGLSAGRRLGNGLTD